MNTRWAIDVIDHLADEGLRHAVICPGSRSAPLALAADAHPDLTTNVHIDERGAAFFALGIARATGRPAAVITTSGTAVANLLPACVEAHQDNVPLLLLTADRPPSLRGTGANQTMDQVGLFSRFVRFEADLPVPAAAEVEHALFLVQEAMHRATAWPPGPVHLNQPLEKPLEPDMDEQEALRRLRLQAPRGASTSPPPVPSGGVPDLPPLGPGGLIVCGPGTGSRLAAAILRLGRTLDAPVLADGLSGLRAGDGLAELPAGDGLEGGAREGTLLASYDLFLGDASTLRLRPRFVLQFGRSPTSNALRGYLAQQPCPRYRFDHSGRGWDDIGGDLHPVACDPQAWLQRLQSAAAAAQTDVDHAGPWRMAWQALERHARHTAAEALARQPDVEAAWVPQVLQHAQRLFVGNSMPVRDLDRFGQPARALDVAANRGVSGIDGTIATAAGWAAAGGAATAVIGDVAFQHDVGSLPLLPEDTRLVVIRNGGGRIFHHLPISKATDRFDRLFLTSPQVDVEAACAAFGIEAVATRPSRLHEALQHGARVVAVDVDGAASARWRQQLEREVHKGVPRLVEEGLGAAQPS